MRKAQDVFRLTLPSNPKSIGRVEAFLKKVQRSAHLDEIQFHKVMVSLTEAVNNAMVHGNGLDGAKKVHIRCELRRGNPSARPDWLLAVVEDEGKGFDPGKVENPLKKKNLLRESGRGIFLMKTLMDKVEFERRDSGMLVHLWLDLNKELAVP